jgi:hypothetical protein
MTNENLPAVVENKKNPVAPLSLTDVKNQVNLIQEIMRQVMKKDEHYGIIPGTKKPTLYKPGAEKLCLTFRLDPELDVSLTALPEGHREYMVVCTMYHIDSGKRLGQGVGLCSTMETKYRYRGGEPIPTGQPVPETYWKKPRGKRDQNLLGGDGFLPFKVKNADGAWVIARKGEKVENPDIADTYNTVLKMASKRAKVDAVLTVTAASDIFTQDLEEKASKQAPAEKSEKKRATKAKKIRSSEQERAAYEEVIEVLGLVDTSTGVKDYMTKNDESLKKDLGDDLFAVLRKEAGALYKILSEKEAAEASEGEGEYKTE